MDNPSKQWKTMKNPWKPLSDVDDPKPALCTTYLYLKYWLPELIQKAKAFWKPVTIGKTL